MAIHSHSNIFWMHLSHRNYCSYDCIALGSDSSPVCQMDWIFCRYVWIQNSDDGLNHNRDNSKIFRNEIFFYFPVILFCLASIVFPIGFSVDEIGGAPYQLPNSSQVGLSYIFFVMALWITVISELFASKVCLPHF